MKPLFGEMTQKGLLASPRVQGNVDAFELFSQEMEKVEKTIPRHLNADPEWLDRLETRLAASA
ncbi:MAG: hypothetical protein NT075_04510 [Chloroflexi bacterium]|nr:hypothetical protein [Chloroflexota bacterium]